jgi:glycosyltransferase involved in cell wall biosynthesis
VAWSRALVAVLHDGAAGDAVVPTGALDASIAIVTNARAAAQHSMMGYGTMVLETARKLFPHVRELEASSALSAYTDRWPVPTRARKVIRDLERFIVSPLLLTRNGADIVHVIDPGNSVYLPLLRFESVVVTVHDLIPYLCLSGRLHGFTPSRKGRALMRQIAKRLTRADRLICVSEATRRDVLELFDPDPARVVVISNAVFQDVGPSSPEARERLRSALDLSPDVPIVLHVGKGFYKNRTTVIRAFAKLARSRPDARLILVGAVESDLVSMMEAEGIAGLVTVLYEVSASRLKDLYTTADVVLFPSIYEGFGYPVIEAQICGTPVICSDAGSLPEVAGDGALVFPCEDAEAMAKAAERLIEDQVFADRLRTLGSRNAQRFTRARWEAGHAALYRAMVGDLQLRNRRAKDAQ